jgi:hypothetical protein
MKTLMIGALVLCLAACTKDKGAGFTGIGPSSSKASSPHYALDFPGYGSGRDPAKN